MWTRGQLAFTSPAFSRHSYHVVSRTTRWDAHRESIFPRRRVANKRVIYAETELANYYRADCMTVNSSIICAVSSTKFIQSAVNGLRTFLYIFYTYEFIYIYIYHTFIIFAVNLIYFSYKLWLYLPALIFTMYKTNSLTENYLIK